MKKKKKSAVEAFLALSDEEKERQVSVFDKECDHLFRPLNPSERALWEKAKRKRGRPPIGAGSDKFFVSMERTLLGKLDKVAEQSQIPRSKLLSMGARLVIAMFADDALLRPPSTRKKAI